MQTPALQFKPSNRIIAGYLSAVGLIVVGVAATLCVGQSGIHIMPYCKGLDALTILYFAYQHALMDAKRLVPQPSIIAVIFRTSIYWCFAFVVVMICASVLSLVSLLLFRVF